MEYKTFTRKICFVGDYGTGKTSIMMRKKYNKFVEFTEATIGSSYCTITEKKTVKNSSLGDEYFNLKLEIWDTAGSERYESLCPMYLRGSNIILIVYDVNSEDCYKSVKKWLNYVIKYCTEEHDIIIVGNKSDLFSSQNTNLIECLCEETKFSHIKVSCKTISNIDKLFNEIDNISIEKYKIYRENLNKQINTSVVEIKNDTDTTTLSRFLSCFY